MFFQQRPDYLYNPTPLQTTTIAVGTGSQDVRIALQRNFPIESIRVQVTFDAVNRSTTASLLPMTCPNPDGLQNILKRVNLQISDGVRTRTVIDASGPDLLEMAVNTRGSLDTLTEMALGQCAAQNNSPGFDQPASGEGYIPAQIGDATFQTRFSGQDKPLPIGAPVSRRTYRITYPIDFCPTEVLDPLSSLFLLPVTRYPSDPVLTLTFAGFKDLDVNTAATAAASCSFENVTYEIYIDRRFVNVTNWNYIDFDFVTQASVIPPGTINEFRIELLTPGSYFGTKYKGYVNTNLPGTSIATIPVVCSNPTQVGPSGAMRIESLGVNFRRFSFTGLKTLNDLSRGTQFLPNGDPFFAGVAYNDFLTDRCTDATELGSVLDANVPVASGAQISLYGNYGAGTGTPGTIFGSAGVTLRQLHWRAYGDLSSLKGVK
jgi:hypothetical protein